jgi:hypothetical protein
MHFKLSRHSLWPSVTSVVKNSITTESTEFTSKFTALQRDNLKMRGGVFFRMTLCVLCGFFL